MRSHNDHEIIDLKLECARVSFGGGFSPVQSMHLAFDLYNWCLEDEDTDELIDLTSEVIRPH